MVITQINLAQPQQIDFAPANVLIEVAQNVYTLLSTDKYTVPLDRDFGLAAAFIDQPINLIQAQLRAEIMEAIARYEPRFIVQEIDFQAGKGARQGQLYPIVRGGVNV